MASPACTARPRARGSCIVGQTLLLGHGALASPIVICAVHCAVRCSKGCLNFTIFHDGVQMVQLQRLYVRAVELNQLNTKV